MNIISGYTRQQLMPPPPPSALEIVPVPDANAAVQAAIQDSVQEFPAPSNISALWGAEISRGPILPPYGTKERDYYLRVMYRNEYNNLVQAVVSGLTKKMVTIPFVINGPKKKNIYIPDDNGRMKSISAVQHFENVFNYAQFGAGWAAYLSPTLEDMFTQDLGGVTEFIGSGDPMGAIEGPVMGIAHLDAGRCYVTGNRYYPLTYSPLLSGSFHWLPAQRISRMVDSPSGDERFFGMGLCALSRTAAVQHRQQFMNQYIEGIVDDKPKPGILSFSNMTDIQIAKLIEKYNRSLQSDQQQVFGKTMIVTGMDLEKEIKINHMPFSETPEKFDWPKYTELDVHALAAGFNIDVQEIWELTGRQGLGSTAQSATLHQKSEAKMTGWILTELRRIFNRGMLAPYELEMDFKYNDPAVQEREATVDGQLATTTMNLIGAGLLDQAESRLYLMNMSDRFKAALNDNQGSLQGNDAVEGIYPDDIPSISDMKVPPMPALPAATGAPSSTESNLQPRAKPAVARVSQPRKQRSKDFSATALEFIRAFVQSVSGALSGSVDRTQLEGELLDNLSASATKSFIDGMRTGGENGMPSLAEQEQIQGFLVDQIDYIDSLAASVSDGTIGAAAVNDRAAMWVTKSLQTMYYAGLASANPDIMMEFGGSDGEESCDTCQRLKGQRHTLAEWQDAHLVPGVMDSTDQYICGGFKCKHTLTPTRHLQWGTL